MPQPTSTAVERAAYQAAGLSLDSMLRTPAIVLVLVIHSASGYLSRPLTVPTGGGLAWGAAARPAVPLFYMYSGALMLGRELTPRRIFSHNLPRILYAMFVWAFIY